MNNSCARVSSNFTGRFLPPVYILVFIVGLIANLIGLKFLLQNWTKLFVINVFVLNLALADVLYILMLPLRVFYYLKSREWIFGEIFCKVTRFCFNMNLYGSIGFLTCIGVSRYLAIVHPVRVMGQLTTIHSVVISVLVWVLVSVQSLPDMFFPKMSANRNQSCFDTTSNEFVEDYLTYSLGWTVTGFCLPLLIIMGCYSHAIVTLFCSSSTYRCKRLRFLMVTLLLFSVCYIPYHVFKNLNLWVRVLIKKKQCYSWFNMVYMAHQVSRGLVCLNPALNPLVYLHVIEELSSGFRALIGRTQRVLYRNKMSSITGDTSSHVTDQV
ncbi:hypothetical protein WMY93_009620 [Mugilogobius chulae]|uniref:G-protein coupled receptors family 1 profile domain-containing protein n=1 Tax=Mugilogobius chulae TaxID=88201 RepID=A0AAW0PFD6_9GOBI